MAHADLRVRQKAQFELVERLEADVLASAALADEPGGDATEVGAGDNTGDDRGDGTAGDTGDDTEAGAGGISSAANGAHLARIHGIWGLWQISRSQPKHASILVELLGDGDAEVRAQAAKVMGDLRYSAAARSLLPLLQDENARVRFFAAEALGRIGHGPAFQPIVEMIARNAGEDTFLRHAGSLAMSRVASGHEIAAMAMHPSDAVRLAAVIALRRLGHPGIIAFLDDANEHIVTDAARAINDDGGIPQALPALARTLADTPFSNEPLLRRAISANLRVGSDEAAARLAAFAAHGEAPEDMRAEALEVLGVWPEPSVLDRVDGVYLGPAENDVDHAREAVEPLVPALLSAGGDAARVAAAGAAAKLELDSAEPHLMTSVQQDAAPAVRIAALEALFDLDSDLIEDAVRAAMSDDDTGVRMAAVRLIRGLDLDDAANAELLSAAVESGSLEERQSAIAALGSLDSDETRAVLERLVERFEAGDLPQEIHLDVAEAVAVTGSDELNERIAAVQQARPTDGAVAAYSEALYGGNPNRGARTVYDHAGGQCMRCHRVLEWGADVGPELTTIGDRLKREQLLESLVAPSARIAPGYGTVSVTLESGDVVTGLLQAEDDEHIVLQTGSLDERRIARSDIASRTNAPSAMPPMGHVLTMRELRDVVSFLTTLQDGTMPPRRRD